MTAVVCTYNRSESLRDTLNSLKRQSLPNGATLEIVVVDNNSADRTADAVKEAAADSPWPVRCVVEKAQGIAHARNRGLQEGRGKYIAFVDDDAVAEPDWAAQILRSFEETGSDMVGGKVVPMWLAPKPSWLTTDLMGPMPRVDFGPARKRCTRMSETFLTTNCAVRKSSLTKHGIFDVTLGRRRNRWVGGEDLELCQRWIAAGAVVTYEPAAVVQHKISADRITPEFYRQWFEDIGYTQAHQLPWKWHLSLTIMPVWRWKELFRAWAKHAATPKELRAELWWLFQKSFLKERLCHWRAHWLRITQPNCRFARAV